MTNNVKSESNGNSGENDFIIRIRGLPWQATREDIVNFFSDCKIKNGINGIHMTLSKEGRPSGEAYLEMENEEEFEKAKEYHKRNMGSRYIEVFTSKRQEMDWMIKRSGVTYNSDPNCDGFVRLRGLPFGSKSQDIENFFAGLEIVANGIVLPVDHQGRATGEAYVQFATREIAEKAMGKHKDKIGHRYIEIFKSSHQEFRAVCNYTYGDPFGNGPPPPHHQQQQQQPHHHMAGPTGHHYNPQQGPPNNSVSYPPTKFRYGLANRPSPYDRGGYGGYRGGAYGGARGPPAPGGASRRGAFIEDYDTYRYGGRPGFGGGVGGGGGGNRYPYDGPPSPDNYNMPRHSVHMRGLPYKATQQDIFDFFRPLQVYSVRMLTDNLGRPSGEADVYFASHEEATKAMNKDKANMQHRYIELFLHSAPSPPAPVPPPPPAPVPPPASYGDPRYSMSMSSGPPQPVPPPPAQGGDNTGSSMGGSLGGYSLMGGLLSSGISLR